MTLQEKIEKVVEERLSPTLGGHGGGVEIVEIDEKNGLVKLKFLGACIGCPMGDMTFDGLIKDTLLSEIEELENVELV
ncbi:MAG: NifU family protein [Candidatus Magasanikbacteria bacterium]|nr:NifU family protein [Candidatus Magasanikbacteria bacterium]MBT4547231.1 NifU family protein [Candidatus Magasanikbacteria bacterium]